MLRQSRWGVVAGIIASMSFVVAVVFMFLQAQVVQAEVSQNILYVAPGGNCGAAAPCFDNVQAAVDAAADGDEIRIATGTYTQTHARPIPTGYVGYVNMITQTVYITKSLTVRGGYTTGDWSTSNPNVNPTVLDAQYNGRVVVMAGFITATVEGLQLTGGNPSWLGGGSVVYLGHDVGGAIFVLSATVTIIDNQIINNWPTRFCWGSDGGGIALIHGKGTIVRNHFENNVAHSGGGMSVWQSETVIEDNVFKHNVGTPLCWGGENGGLYVYSYYGPKSYIKNNTFILNESGNGSGAAWIRGLATVEGNVFAFNSGWGVTLFDFQGDFTNNAVVSNRGGINVDYYANATLNHNTVYNNGFIGILSSEQSHITMTNMIIGEHSYYGVWSGPIIIDSVLWFNNGANVNTSSGPYIITNAYEGDPAIIADGYHISPLSAAIDRGVSSFATVDIDGTPRPAGAAPDLGADEFPELTDWFYLPVLLFPQ